MNLTLAQLKNVVGPDASGVVYTYVVETVRPRKGSLAVSQVGSGPNFQGGRITLCTCKHPMRAGSDRSDWVGRWIAGFSSKRAGQPQRLFYLMRIARAFESHAELWRALESDVRKAKSMSASRFGDICEPKPHAAFEGEFDPSSYSLPCADHVHANSWHRDLNKEPERNRKGRRAALLLGAEGASFVWSSPSLALHGAGDYKTIMQGNPKMPSIGFLLSKLEQVQ
jgi:hypothetical protein